MTLEQKVRNLQDFIQSHKRVAIAFSGGVDSTFLSKMAFQVLGDDSVALTVDTIFVPREEMEEASELAKIIGIPHHIISIASLDDEVLENKRERCYQCKTLVFQELLRQAQKMGFDVVFDGSNIDDLSDFRPGLKALHELNIVSPLVECELTKDDIRRASKEMDLPTWDKPSLACLASRIPYHQEITKEALQQVEKSETLLRSMGLKQVRVRHHQELARIEIDADDRSFFSDLERLDYIARTLKSFGFKYVTFDLEGYQSGKMN